MLEIETREVKAHSWTRAEADFYVEPRWCSSRLFDVEPFNGTIWDPACGLGHIVDSAGIHGYETAYSDIRTAIPRDFFRENQSCDNIVTNPPFNLAEKFFYHSVGLARGKIAMIFPVARLNAARWIKDAPLVRVWLLTPRPSMPPGLMVLSGQNPKGGKTDFCWLVWEKNGIATGELKWLHRDGNK
jgi:hypothetical protein